MRDGLADISKTNFMRILVVDARVGAW